MGSRKRKTSAGGDMGRHDLIDHISGKAGIERRATAFGTNTLAGDNGLLVSHEIMLEGIDFNLVYFPLKHLGYKFVVRAIAGIYVSGGIPEALTFTLGMSNRFALQQVDELIAGVKLAAERYGVDIRFFDIVSSMTGLTLAGSAWGYRAALAVPPAPPAVNDLICVSGDLGAAYIGLQVLERERRIFESRTTIQPDLSGYEYTISKQLKPGLKTGLFDDMKKHGLEHPSAATVIREGLASELTGLCRDNKKGCRLYYDRIPVDNDTYRNASEMNIDPVTAALNGGEDYEFLFFLPLTNAETAGRIEKLHIVGYLTDMSEGCYLVVPDGSLVELRAQGWSVHH